jgi:hypothetical protein
VRVEGSQAQRPWPQSKLPGWHILVHDVAEQSGATEPQMVG